MAYIRTHLISGPSAVSLVLRPEDWTRLLSSSLSLVLRPRPALRRFSVPQATESWAGPGNDATVVSRNYLSSYMSSTPCSIFCPGLTLSVFFLLCRFNSVARSVTFDSTFRFLLRCLQGPSWVTSRTRWWHIDEPRCFISRTRCFHINYPLDLR